ncbi:hypothetical protein GGX14DRAFT_630897, partial [Mycena pura]
VEQVQGIDSNFEANIDSDHETCRTYSDDPRIIQADYRHGQAPDASYFFYFPHKPVGDASIVFLDHLRNIQKISRWDLWKNPVPSQDVTPLYALELSSDKGMAMVARRKIQVGELIASERPLVVSRTNPAIAEDQNKSGIFYRAALSGLSAAARKSVLSLRNSFGPEREPILGILLTNCLPVTIPGAPETQYSGLFPVLCRANHDCSPNANFFFNTRSFTGQLHAVHSIAENEEITVLYSELAAPRKERQAELLEHYKFLCECRTCSLPLAQAEESDARRRAIGEMIPLMHRGVYADDLTVARIEELLAWAQEEGLHALYSQLLVYGYGLATKLGLQDISRTWSRMAANAYKILNGADFLRFN